MQLMWGLMPQLAQAKWALRRGAWLRRWLALLVVLSERCVLTVYLTALSRLFPRADNILWASMCRRLIVLWLLFGAQLALVGVVTWTKARVDAVMTHAPDPWPPLARAVRKRTGSQRGAVVPLPSEKLGVESEGPLRPKRGHDTQAG